VCECLTRTLHSAGGSHTSLLGAGGWTELEFLPETHHDPLIYWQQPHCPPQALLNFFCLPLQFLNFTWHFEPSFGNHGHWKLTQEPWREEQERGAPPRLCTCRRLSAAFQDGKVVLAGENTTLFLLSKLFLCFDVAIMAIWFSPLRGQLLLESRKGYQSTEKSLLCLPLTLLQLLPEASACAELHSKEQSNWQHNLQLGAWFSCKLKYATSCQSCSFVWQELSITISSAVELLLWTHMWGKEPVTWMLLTNPVCLWAQVHTSARFWQARGVRQGTGNRQAGLSVELNSAALAALHYCILLSPQASLEKWGSYCSFQQHWLTTKNLHCCGTKRVRCVSKHTDLSTTMWVVPQPIAASKVCGTHPYDMAWVLAILHQNCSLQLCLQLWHTLHLQPAQQVFPVMCARKYCEQAFLITEWYGLWIDNCFIVLLSWQNADGKMNTCLSLSTHTCCASAVGTYGGECKALSVSRPPLVSTHCLCRASEPALQCHLSRACCHAHLCKGDGVQLERDVFYTGEGCAFFIHYFIVNIMFLRDHCFYAQIDYKHFSQVLVQF